MRANSICAEHGCPKIADGNGGRCKKHERPAWYESGRPRRKDLPKDWGRIKRYIIRRDGELCQLRLEGCTGVATTADHVGDRRDHSFANLVASCRKCNERRASKQGNDVRNKRAAAVDSSEPEPVKKRRRVVSAPIETDGIDGDGKYQQ